MNWLTHTSFILITFVLPLISIQSMRRMKQFLQWGQMPDLTLNNIISALLLWLMALATIGVWFYQGEGIQSLGINIPGPGAYLISAIIILCAILIVSWTAQRIKINRAFRDRFLDSMDYVIAILPRTRRERNSFFALSLTAGVCEEILYRGFVFAYLANYMDLVWVVLITSLLFGIAHSYQGLRGIPQTGLVGLALALLYVFTGSLLASMVLHALIDMGYGYLSWLALQHNRGNPTPEESGAGLD